MTMGVYHVKPRVLLLTAVLLLVVGNLYVHDQAGDDNVDAPPSRLKLTAAGVVLRLGFRPGWAIDAITRQFFHDIRSIDWGGIELEAEVQDGHYFQGQAVEGEDAAGL